MMPPVCVVASPLPPTVLYSHVVEVDATLRRTGNGEQIASVADAENVALTSAAVGMLASA